MSHEHQASYRNIIKATGIFGGVQVISILISMVRTKFVAILLGTHGVGLMGLLSAPLSLIYTICGLGISYSAIRDISESVRYGDKVKISRTLITFRRLTKITGLFGMITTMIFSSWLSEWVFGSKEYTWAFIWLSITLLINSISDGQKAVLQGMSKLQSLAKASVIGSLIGLLFSIPLYYKYNIQGIVPAIIFSSIISLILSWYFAKKIPINNIKITIRESFIEGKSFIRLGIILSISTQIGSFVRFLILRYINNYGGMDEVGLYSAGISFMVTYVGLIFTAMSTDYYPKLAAISKDNELVRRMVNQQAIISTLLILPIIISLLLSMPLVIKVFLTEKFIEITTFVNLMALGVFLQAISYTVGYISFAKGDSKFFFWLEGVFSNSLTLILSILGYRYFGLKGIGIAFILQYSIYISVLYFFTHRRYSFSFYKESIKIFIISALIIILTYISIIYLKSIYFYLTIILLFIISVFYSYKELEPRIGIKSIISNKIEFLKKLLYKS